MKTNQILKLFSSWGSFTILLFVLGALVLNAVTVHAETGTPPANQNANDRLAKAFQQEQNVFQTQTVHLSKAGGAVSKLQGVIDKAKTKGLDTSSLEQALVTFKAQLATAQSSHDTAASILSIHDGFDANGAVTNVDSARQTLKDAHQSLADVRTVLKQAVQDLHATFKTWREENKDKVMNANLVKTYQRQQEWLKKQADNLGKTNDVISKVQNLIQRGKDKNLNTSSLEQALSIFQSQVSTAQKSHDTAANILSTHNGFDGSGNITNGDAAHITVKDARQSLLDAHNILKQSGQDLRAAIQSWRKANNLQTVSPTAQPTITQ